MYMLDIDIDIRHRHRRIHRCRH